jgi:hypothetical protein
MGKFTHSKVLTELVDNAVGYMHALVFVAKWDIDKATEAAKNRYQLDLITMAVVTLKYKASVVDFVDPTVLAQKAIAQYTLDEIAALQAEQKEDTRSANIKAADAVLTGERKGTLSSQAAIELVKEKAKDKPVQGLAEPSKTAAKKVTK